MLKTALATWSNRNIHASKAHRSETERNDRQRGREVLYARTLSTIKKDMEGGKKKKMRQGGRGVSEEEREKKKKSIDSSAGSLSEQVMY